VEKVANQGNLSAAFDIIRSLLCIKWQILGLWFNFFYFGYYNVIGSIVVMVGWPEIPMTQSLSLVVFQYPRAFAVILAR
jgi:hypothetical protein